MNNYMYEHDCKLRFGKESGNDFPGVIVV